MVQHCSNDCKVDRPCFSCRTTSVVSIDSIIVFPLFLDGDSCQHFLDECGSRHILKRVASLDSLLSCADSSVSEFVLALVA